jgi:hypothetical protein
MRSALAGLRPSADFSFDNFALRANLSSRFGHGKTSHNPLRYRKYTVTRNLLTLFLLLMSLNLQGQNATIENEYSFTGSLGYNSHFGTEATIGIFLLDKDSSQSGFIYSFEVGSNYNLETFDLFINLAAIWSVGIGGTGFEIAFVFNDLNTEYYFSVRPQYSVHLTPFLTFRPGLDFSSAEIIPYFTVVIGWF